MQVGTTVRLRSAGPLMTVRQLDDDAQLLCIWFVDGVLRWDRFKPEELLIVPDDESPLPRTGARNRSGG